MDFLLPNKTDVLNFLAGGPEPPRYATATIMFADVQSPYQEEFVIGPLPVGRSTTIQSRPFVSRANSRIPSHAATYTAKWAFGPSVMQMHGAELKTLWNLVQYSRCRKWDVAKRADRLGPQTDAQLQTVQVGGFAIPEIVDGRTIQWFEFTGSPVGPSDSGTLLPMGLYVRADITDPDMTKWNMTGWLYNNVLYPDMSVFSQAMKDPSFERLGVSVDGPWAHTSRQGQRIQMDEQPPPVPVQPGSPRYLFNSSENYVSWSMYQPCSPTSHGNMD
jgi:primary-amine oxidase